MAEPAHTTNPPEIDRRHVVAGLAAISLAAPTLTPAQALEQDHPDAALLMLFDQLGKASARADVLLIKSQEEKTPEADQAWQDAFELETDIVSKIESIPARTLHGLRVKAKAFQWCRGDEPLSLSDQQTTDVRLAEQIVRALLTT